MHNNRLVRPQDESAPTNGKMSCIVLYCALLLYTHDYVIVMSYLSLTVHCQR